MLPALHTAYTYSITPVATGGVDLVIREKLKIEPEVKVAGKPFNMFGFTIIDELVENPREVKLFMAAPGAGLVDHMSSMTDDLIYNQWFRVKVHKKSKQQEA